MPFPRRRGTLLVAAIALVFGFLLAAQIRAQVLVPGNRVERNRALDRTVHDLERANAEERRQLASLRDEIGILESSAAQRSESGRRLAEEVAQLRAHAGLTVMRGPGVSVTLANGRVPGETSKTGYLVTYEDVQDVVNALFEGGAEGVAVNGRRISPASSFNGSRDTLVIDQDTPIQPPFRITAVGNRGGMEQHLADPGVLGDLRYRQATFLLGLSWSGSPELSLPAYDSSLTPRYAHPI